MSWKQVIGTFRIAKLLASRCSSSSTTASLVQPPQFTKPRASSPAPAPEEEDDLSVEVKPGTRCKRKGCKAEFISDEESRLGEGESTVCTYHPSNVSLPIFCDAQILMLSSSLSFMKVARSVSHILLCELPYAEIL